MTWKASKPHLPFGKVGSAKSFDLQGFPVADWTAIEVGRSRWRFATRDCTALQVRQPMAAPSRLPEANGLEAQHCRGTCNFCDAAPDTRTNKDCLVAKVVV